MKNLLLLLIPALTFCQVGRTEQIIIATKIDPVASIKEESPCFGFEIEANSNLFYIRAETTFFPKLEGNYKEINFPFGITKTFGFTDKYRLYGGFRMGLIGRGGNPYPTVGIESGLDFNPFNSKFIIGGRITFDYRSDWEFWNGNPGMRQSGFIKIGYIIE